MCLLFFAFFAFLLIWHPFYLKCTWEQVNFKLAMLSSDDKPSSLYCVFSLSRLHTLIYHPNPVVSIILNSIYKLIINQNVSCISHEKFVVTNLPSTKRITERLLRRLRLKCRTLISAAILIQQPLQFSSMQLIIC
jgi:hypothetical protein